ncbi:MAG: chitobiase/beta-hexosaminidase C-terminal domain-containing protein, partial [Armatimonadota bacterium]
MASRIYTTVIALLVCFTVLSSNQTVHAGTTELLSISTSDIQGNANSGWNIAPAISADGRYAAFNSIASNLVPGDTNNACDVFIRDRVSGTTERVSVSASAEQGNNESGFEGLSMSGDSRYIAFSSIATNLVSGDNNGRCDIFVKDRVTGAVRIASLSSSGTLGNNVSIKPCISTDGRYVTFESFASNLVSGDNNGQCDVFMRDLINNTTTRISVSSTEQQADYDSHNPSISSNGRYVAFQSYAHNLVPEDTGTTSGIFIRDLVNGTTELVSLSSIGIPSNAYNGNPSISSDGRYVAFESSATNLITGDTNGQDDIYVRDTLTDTISLVSISTSGSQGNGRSFTPCINADGRYVAFESSATNFVPGDINGHGDMFIRDITTGITEMVSVSSAGEYQNHQSYSPSISANGRYVAFCAYSNNLVPDDTNGMWDAFLRDRSCVISAPKLTPDGGSYTSAQNVVLTCDTQGALIHYTTDSTDPTEDDPAVSPGASVVIDHNLILKTKTYVSSYIASAVKTS